MEIVEEEEKLFAEWRKRHDKFVYDGVFDENAYLSSKLKLLFLLKEANSDDSDWILEDRVQTNKDRSTWDDLARWAYGISKLPEDVPWSEARQIGADSDGELRRDEILRPIAAMNLKKCPGKGRTYEKEFLEVVKRDKDLIREQFDLYKADLVVCCSSIVARAISHALGTLVWSEWSETNSGIKWLRYQGGLIVSYVHPEAHCPDNLKYAGIVAAVRELHID